MIKELTMNRRKARAKKPKTKPRQHLIEDDQYLFNFHDAQCQSIPQITPAWAVVAGKDGVTYHFPVLGWLRHIGVTTQSWTTAVCLTPEGPTMAHQIRIERFTTIPPTDEQRW